MRSHCWIACQTWYVGRCRIVLRACLLARPRTDVCGTNSQAAPPRAAACTLHAATLELPPSFSLLRPQNDNLLALCSSLAANLGDNNVNVSNGCSRLVARLAELVDASRLDEACDILGEPLGEVFGNAKPAPRELAAGAALALTRALGPRALAAMLTPRLLAHRNWRVAEGLLSAFAAAAAAGALPRGPAARALEEAALSGAAAGLAAPAPELRRAALEAAAAVAARWGLPAVQVGG